MDGRFDDWATLAAAVVDPQGDGGASGIDFGAVWLANDEANLFLRFELGSSPNLQNDNGLVLYLDTDLSSSTGRLIGGIGADVSWWFGSRIGFLHTSTGDVSFDAYDADVVSLPTVTSSEFEVSFGRDAVMSGQGPLFPGASFRWLLREEGQGTGDAVPDSGQSATYVFDDTPTPSYEPISSGKGAPEHLRIVSYNCLVGGFFERVEAFTPILQAIQPDILCFQELWYYNYTAEETRQLVEQILPPGSGNHWYAAQQHDNVIVSRYPIVTQEAIDGNLATVIDLPQALGEDLLLLSAHLPASDNDANRQLEADAIIAFLRDAKTPGGALSLEEGTPIVLVGDLNLVGLAQQLETLLTGDIVNEGTYGADHAPDWDGSALADAVPFQTGEAFAYTWWDEGSSYGPGRLDFIIYSDSVLALKKSFVLRTESMSDEQLALGALERDVTSTASDHLPVVADFTIRTSVPGLLNLY